MATSIVPQYGSSGEEEEEEEKDLVDFKDSLDVVSKLKEKISINSAPIVPTREQQGDLLRIQSTTKEVMYNPTYDQLFAPEVGPDNPYKTQQQKAHKNMLSGFVEPAHIDRFQFENQRRTYESYGFAVNPSADTDSHDLEFIGDEKRLKEMGGATVGEVKVVKTGQKRKRLDKGDPGDVDGYQGPWREYEGQVKVACPTPEEKVILEAQRAKKIKDREVPEEENTINETTTLHIDDPVDYMGRSFLHIPQDVDINLRSENPPEKCFAPKKAIYTWSGHTRGISNVRLFPKSGHLVLSASLDTTCKLWEVYHDRRCLRTYHGHLKALRDICFNNDGSRFLSCSYDRYIKLWDTETGQCIGRYTNQKAPYCIAFNPDEDKQHLFVVGCADKKIYTWNTETAEIVQEYDRHLGAVNTVTFVDENRRFVTTSDDKSLRVWEWDIPVDMKYVAEPHMHSMPAVTLDPSGKWLACQSMDNQIMCYGVHTNFRLNRRKCFRGHNVAGYSCKIAFSPDGSIVASGEANGGLCFWDWKTKKMKR
jgi:pre-mRNA-processing factor 17